jgi:hypothetical protein
VSHTAIETDDPGEASLDGPGYRVTRATGCIRGLTWDLELTRPIDDWGGARRSLGQAGWSEESRLEGLYDCSAPEGGHHLVIVPRSNWLQLRLSYLLPPAERTFTARRLAERISAIVTARTTPPPGYQSAHR